MGLAVAHELSARGHSVEVIEAAPQVGGLTTWYDFGSFVWDKFYHVILPSDRYLIEFIRNLGMENELRWQTTRTGFFVDRELYSLSTNLEYLKFPPLSLWSKFRLALTILYCSRINDWRKLERQFVEEWLRTVSGQATYEKLWKPLLLAKLGDAYRRVSAVFIWSYIKRMFSARDGSAQKEQLGHVSGGYKAIFSLLTRKIEETGGTIWTDSPVENLRAGSNGGIDVRVGGKSIRFDKVIYTGPAGLLTSVAEEQLIDMQRSGNEVEYLGVVCLVIVTRKPITPFYVLNIADERIPFTGVIGMSTVVDPVETSNRYLTYLPKYVLSTDKFLDRDDASIEREFLVGLSLIFPGFDHADIESVHVNRARRVQPLQVLNYSSIVPRIETRHPNLFVLNTSQFVNNTLNNNEVIRAVTEFFETHDRQF